MKTTYSFIEPLTVLINKTFIHGVFPDELKIGKSMPLLKSDSSL